MSTTEPPAQASKIVKTIVVPASLYHAAHRANLHLMDLTDFSKLRKISSLEDIAVFAALNDGLAVRNTRIATNHLIDIVSLGGGNLVEYNVTFQKMAKQEEIIKLAFSEIEPVSETFADLLELKLTSGVARPVPNKRLSNTLGTANPPVTDSTYQLKTSGSNVFVVVGHGFSKYVGAPCAKECSESFIRAFLTHCGGLYSPAEVARHPLFKTFLHSLAA